MQYDAMPIVPRPPALPKALWSGVIAILACSAGRICALIIGGSQVGVDVIYQEGQPLHNLTGSGN